MQSSYGRDENRCSNGRQKMPEQDALETGAFQSEMPGEQAGNNDGYREDRRPRDVVVRGDLKRWILRPRSDEVKARAHDEKRNGEMNQDNMLRVLCQQNRLGIERIHIHFFSSTTILPTILGWRPQKY